MAHHQNNMRLQKNHLAYHPGHITCDGSTDHRDQNWQQAIEERGNKTVPTCSPGMYMADLESQMLQSNEPRLPANLPERSEECPESRSK